MLTGWMGTGIKSFLPFLSFSPFLFTCIQKLSSRTKQLTLSTATMPAECDAVLEGKLYVGNYAAAQNADLLDHHRITHIVSAGFQSGHFSTSKYRYLCVDITDSPHENLLRHLPRATTFIQKALGGGGRVFVHCVHGQSRSCAIVVAYLMRMTSNNNNTCDHDDHDGPNTSLLHQCYHQVETARPCMAINPGFVKQLEIYRRMLCSTCNTTLVLPPMSRAHAAFRSYRARSEFEESGRIAKWFPLSSVSAGDGSIVSYRCSKCRHMLFHDSSIVEELTKEEEMGLPKSEYWATSAGGLEYSRRSKNKDSSAGHQPTTSSSTDSLLKIEPIDWMRPQMEASSSMGMLTKSGKLTCPHCSSKIGAWDWGYNADAWSSVFITPSRVEKNRQKL